MGTGPDEIDTRWGSLQPLTGRFSSHDQQPSRAPGAAPPAILHETTGRTIDATTATRAPTTNRG